MNIKIDGIDRILKRVESMRSSLEPKCNELLRRLAEEGFTVASSSFAAYEDQPGDISVTLEWDGENSVSVVARGQTVLFIEFGTGIRYPDNHPLAGKFGAERGKYGYHLGSNPGGWRYQGEPGRYGEVIKDGKHEGEIHTFGNPASMSMYEAGKTMRQRVNEIAKEVFSK